MESFCSPRVYCPIAARMPPGQDIDQIGGSVIPDPACYFGRYTVAGRTADPAVEASYPGPRFCHSALQPSSWIRPTVPLHQCCNTQLTCTRGLAVPPTLGQQTSPNEPALDSSAVTCQTDPSGNEPPPEESVSDAQVFIDNALGSVRRNFEPWQKNILEVNFQFDNYVSREACRRLSNALGVSEKQVKVWFQNRRTKERRGRVLAQRPSLLEGCPLNVSVRRDYIREMQLTAANRVFRLITGEGREIIKTVAQTPLDALHAMYREIRICEAPPLYAPMQEFPYTVVTAEPARVTSTLGGARWQPSPEADRSSPPHSEPDVQSST